MRRLPLLACLTIGLGFVAAVRADEPLRTTTEFGITITADDLGAAIQEAQDFWDPVLQYLSGNDFAEVDAETRKAVARFFVSVHEGVSQKLFDGNDDSVEDLVDYLTLRLRKFVIYRQLREAIDDDAAFAELIERWERAHRDINALAVEQRSARVEAVLGLISDEMKALGVAEERCTKAYEIWTLQSQCLARMAGTETGKMMIGFEHTARQMDRATGELIRQVASAADWAAVKKQGNSSLTLNEFKAAWAELAQLRAKRLTMATPANRQ
ncbi:MAG TPA: hypothetical protein VG713_10840 [Pirellulales bacterium]|nr:hypothetical protein [Pirellulales bacterium]